MSSVKVAVFDPSSTTIKSPLDLGCPEGKGSESAEWFPAN